MLSTKYVAGWTDADGSFGINRQERENTYLGFSLNGRIRFSNTDEKILREIEEFLRFYNIKTSKVFLKPRKKEKDCYNIVITRGDDCIHFLDMVYDFLITKKERAKLLRRFLISRKVHYHYTKEEISIYKKLKELNRRGR